MRKGLFNLGLSIHFKSPIMTKRNILIILIAFVFTSCDLLEEDATSAEWPSSINGCNINIYIDKANGDSVEGIIRYTFSAPNQEVRGTNPETGQTFTADSYTYSTSGSTAIINLSYSNGQAYENYVLELKSDNGGDYNMSSATPTASGSSNGTFDFTCF